MKLLAAGGAAALVVAIAMQLIPQPPPEKAQTQFEEAWDDTINKVKNNALRKADRINTEPTAPKPVVTERVVTPIPPVVPLAALPDVDRPGIKRKRHTADICRGKGKRYTRGGKSWRCRR